MPKMTAEGNGQHGRAYVAGGNVVTIMQPTSVAVNNQNNAATNDKRYYIAMVAKVQCARDATVMPWEGCLCHACTLYKVHSTGGSMPTPRRSSRRTVP